LLFNDQFHLFVRGLNGALYHGVRQTDSLSSWRFEQVGGAIVGSPTAVVDGSRMVVAMTGTNGAVYTVTGTSFAWGPFARISNQVEGAGPTQVLTRTPPSLVRNLRSGQITIYAAGLTSGLFAITRLAASTFANQLWVRIGGALPSDARISAAVNIHNDTVVYARFLDRTTGQYRSVYTQRTLAGPEWSDYVLVPYTCFECAPYDSSGLGVAARPMPRLPVVLDSNKSD
jgi:hypothetical protein